MEDERTTTTYFFAPKNWYLTNFFPSLFMITFDVKKRKTLPGYLWILSAERFIIITAYQIYFDEKNRNYAACVRERKVKRIFFTPNWFLLAARSNRGLAPKPSFPLLLSAVWRCCRFPGFRFTRKLNLGPNDLVRPQSAKTRGATWRCFSAVQRSSSSWGRKLIPALIEKWKSWKEQPNLLKSLVMMSMKFVEQQFCTFKITSVYEIIVRSK